DLVAVGDDGDRSSSVGGADADLAGTTEVDVRVTGVLARHERDELDGESGQERLLEQDDVDEPVVELRLGGESESAPVAARVRQARCQAPEAEAPAVDGQLEFDALRRQDRPQDPVQVNPAARDALGRIRVPLDGRIETEADISETDQPIEVEDIDDAIAAIGDDGHGRRDVLRDAELADEVVAAAAGDDAQSGSRAEQSGGDRARHPIAAECDDDPCAIRGAAGSELLCVFLARASHEPCLETVCGKGLDQRIDAFEHGTPAGGGVEDHGHGRAIGFRVCGSRDAGVLVFGVVAHSFAGPFMSFPGFMMLAGSTSALTARSIRSHLSPVSAGSHGAWSVPTAWWWVIVPPPATMASPAADFSAFHWAISAPTCCLAKTV